ncbi:MAG TPA: heme exporter protein CcmD [Hyphomonadaceae bacterium]|nr:heme exporter protein CcmD [Hyphomonadaceae bacterium]
MADFLNMGGFALYVWPAYGLSLVSIAAITFVTLRFRRRAARDLAERQMAAKQAGRSTDAPQI